jgi:hypothetical protein
MESINLILMLTISGEEDQLSSTVENHRVSSLDSRSFDKRLPNLNCVIHQKNRNRSNPKSHACQLLNCICLS